jgi:hypothetical protein
VILPGVVLVFPKHITRGYFRRRGGEKEEKMEELLVVEGEEEME